MNNAENICNEIDHVMHSLVAVETFYDYVEDLVDKGTVLTPHEVRIIDATYTELHKTHVAPLANVPAVEAFVGPSAIPASKLALEAWSDLKHMANYILDTIREVTQWIRKKVVGLVSFIYKGSSSLVNNIKRIGTDLTDLRDVVTKLDDKNQLEGKFTTNKQVLQSFGNIVDGEGKTTTPNNEELIHSLHLLTDVSGEFLVELLNSLNPLSNQVGELSVNIDKLRDIESTIDVINTTLAANRVAISNTAPPNASNRYLSGSVKFIRYSAEEFIPDGIIVNKVKFKHKVPKRLPYLTKEEMIVLCDGAIGLKNSCETTLKNSDKEVGVAIKDITDTLDTLYYLVDGSFKNKAIDRPTRRKLIKLINATVKELTAISKSTIRLVSTVNKYIIIDIKHYKHFIKHTMEAIDADVKASTLQY